MAAEEICASFLRRICADLSAREAARQAVDDANKLGDLDTADLFTEASRGIDK